MPSANPWSSASAFAAQVLALDRLRRLVDPDELVSEAWLRHQRSPLPEGQFEASLIRTFRRLLVELARRERALKRGGQRLRVPLSDSIAAATPPAPATCLDELTKSLCEEERVLVHFRFERGLSERQISEATGVGVNELKVSWRRARDQLRSALQEAA